LTTIANLVENGSNLVIYVSKYLKKTVSFNNNSSIKIGGVSVLNC